MKHERDDEHEETELDLQRPQRSEEIPDGIVSHGIDRLSTAHRDALVAVGSKDPHERQREQPEVDDYVPPPMVLLVAAQSSRFKSPQSLSHRTPCCDIVLGGATLSAH